MSLYDDVYGLSYKAAEAKKMLLNEDIKQHVNKGFASKEELEEWAHDCLLDKVVYMNMSHKFFYVSHKGELLLYKDFIDYYGSLLFYQERRGAKIIEVPWAPGGYDFYDKAYIAAEQSDGVHRPLYYRDYTVPSGYYNEEKDAFNVAKPFPVFAKETGRDTSHIYIYIQHIAGECAPWLLAWLRAKLLYPTIKTQIVPIIVSRAQGSGKTTFAEVICKALFGKDNVIVSDQYDSTARFNADYADALIVCQEEKEYEDKRNPAGALKSRATATTIRKEQKGVDPIYQESYTDFIMTTNKDVPIKFDGREDQRRFMIMEADEHFTRKESSLADEVFSKLYGLDAEYNKVGVPFQEDKDLIAQFKHELFTRQDIADVPLRNFPKTAAYNRCFTLPRTSEATEIESILRALAPFIKASLEQNTLVTEMPDGKVSDVIQIVDAMQFMPEYKEYKKFVALCRPLVFYEMGTGKPYAHSTVERGIYDCAPWLLAEFGIAINPNMEPLPGGFNKIAGRYRMAPTARFCLANDVVSQHKDMVSYKPLPSTSEQAQRVGERLRVNSMFKVDSNGCFETVNEMKPGTADLKNKSKNVQYMDTFLLESDETSYLNMQLEKQRAQEWKEAFGEDKPIGAKTLYKERLSVAEKEAAKLFNDGIACRVVYSGAKSYHILIRVKDAPETLEQYSWLHAYLCMTVSDKLKFDSSTSDPARLTRSPLNIKRTTQVYGVNVEGEQCELLCDWKHVYDIDWRDLYDLWCHRPLKPIEQTNSKRLIPTKPEYQEAAQAIIDTTFWTNSKWDGQRQACFFPAYRVLRLLGYTHNQLWDEGLMTKGIGNYKKRDEITYWKTRYKSEIIQQIDAQIDEYNSLFEED
ncbi:hypothetical protein HDR60_03250 [bacterium]|nr:hypothetical protein [bacterium]